MLAGQEFAAGSYEVEEETDGIVSIQSAAQRAMVMSLPVESEPRSTDVLEFRNIAGRMHLTGIRLSGETSRSLPVHEEVK